MKKLLSVILSVALLMSMSVTVFAEQTIIQTITVEIPVPSYDYTMTIPADCTLRYGDTDWQSIGSLTVTSDNWDNINNGPYDGVQVTYDFDFVGEQMNGELMNSDGDTIEFHFEQTFHDDPVGFLGNEPLILTDNTTLDYYIRVPDWSRAVAGTIYSSRVTYHARLH